MLKGRWLKTRESGWTVLVRLMVGLVLMVVKIRVILAARVLRRHFAPVASGGGAGHGRATV